MKKQPHTLRFMVAACIIAGVTALAPGRPNRGSGFSSGPTSLSGLRRPNTVGWGPSARRDYYYSAYSFSGRDVYRASAPRGGRSRRSGGGVMRAALLSRRDDYGPAQAWQVGPSKGVTTSQVYKPMSPMRFQTAPARSTGGGRIASAAPPVKLTESSIRSLADAFAKDQKGALEAAEGEVKSLVPKMPGEYRTHMFNGEEAFRAGKYKQAAQHFQAAAKVSDNSPDSLLSLAHAYFALSDGSYDTCAQYLARTFEAFPYLPLVNINPRGFYGRADLYDAAFAKLKAHVKADEKDAAAQLVLGYLLYREKNFPAAREAILNAEQYTQDKTIATGAQIFSNSTAARRRKLLAKAPPMSGAISMPAAGLELALPEGFRPRPLTDVNRALVAIRQVEGQKDISMASVSVCQVAEGTSLDAFMDHLEGLLHADPDVRNLDMANRAELSAPGGWGLARVYTCKYQGRPIAVVRFCFDRNMPPPVGKGKAAPTRVIYMVSLALPAKDIEALVPSFAAIHESIKLIDVVRPIDVPFDPKATKLVVENFGFEIGQPAGWAARQTSKGLEMGQIDYLSGGVVSPKVEVVGVRIPASYNAKSIGQMSLDMKKKEGYGMEVLSEAPAKLAGLDGRQWVIRKTPPAGGEESGTAVAVAPYIVVARIICLPADGEKKDLYAISVSCHSGKIEQAKALMDSVAGTFRIPRHEKPAASSGPSSVSQR